MKSSCQPHIMPLCNVTATSDELLASVCKVLTRVPRKQLKNYFVRHTATSLGPDALKRVQKDWKQFSERYSEFRKTFVATVEEDFELQRILVQLAVATMLLGTIHNGEDGEESENDDEYGLIGGLALFVSAWCNELGRRLFAGCSPVAVFALWSPFMDTFSVDWKWHGVAKTVLISLNQLSEASAPLFPGPAPASAAAQDDADAAKTTQKWSSWQRALPSDECIELFSLAFGQTTALSSRNTFYYNPAAPELQVQTRATGCWAIDVLRAAPEIEEFEAVDDEEEDTAEYDAEIAALKQRVAKKAASDPTAEHKTKK